MTSELSPGVTVERFDARRSPAGPGWNAWRAVIGVAYLAPVATALAMIWAGLVLAAGMIVNLSLGTVSDLADTNPTQAEAVWSGLDTVQNGLGGGNEIVGEVWILLVSWAATQSRVLPRALNYLGSVSGAAGVATIVPALEPVGLIFGLGLIVWFAWLGFVMIRDNSELTTPSTRAKVEERP